MSIIKKKFDFVTVEPLLKLDCHYNIIIGERSNGKSYSVLKYAIQQYYKDGSQLAYVRRNDEDLKGNRARNVFSNLVLNNEIAKCTDNNWDGVEFFRGAWYLTRRIETEKTDEFGATIWTTERNDDPFAYAFALSTADHDKSTGYPRVRNIMFDEFIARIYLADEFVLFENLISTIVRYRDDVKIWMCGNTINRFAPYYREMGLTKIKKQEKGSIDVYRFGDKSKLRVAVYFSDSPAKSGKPSDVYFAFNNPRLDMITGKGNAWEIDIYPHLPIKYARKDVIFEYFIKWDDDIYHCEIIIKGDNCFTYIHEKTTPIKDESALVFTTEYSPKPNYRRKILKPMSEAENKLAWFFRAEKVFYQDNTVGDAIQNYLNWCRM